ncbi:YybH family protein [Ruegeria lacuscaerulensis]|uniref:YybH family protein n=1 Tax=Ruegeria lacuscaerulensis TaxID=55218 RepID=UPI00147BD515|nr:nuclear transport factor 2 family protein [Ruegeria lacuscaerulensis]
MSDIDTVKALDAAIIQGINAKDASKATAPYAEDGAAMPPGAPIMTGHTAIREYWQAAIDGGLSNVVANLTDAHIGGDCAVTMGTLTGSMGGQKLAGKYVLYFRKGDDGWKVQGDIWNFDA